MSQPGSTTHDGAGIDTQQIDDLYSRSGPFVTVYIDSDVVGAEGGPTLGVRWKNLRRELDAGGAGEPTLDAVESAVLGTGEVSDSTLVVVANDDGVLLDGAIGVTSGADMGFYHQLPRLAPVLAWRSSQVPYVGVLTDRLGADIAVVDSEALSRAVSVEGSSMHITRSAPGGWSQRRYQQRAENQWEQNAAEVGEEVGRLVDEVGAAFIAVAGDVRAVQFLEEHLSDQHKALVNQVRGGRQPGDDLDGAAEDVVRLQANAAAERVVATLEQFAAGRTSARAVDGPDATFEALQRGLVDRLLVVDDLEPGKASEHCWISDEPMMLSTHGSELRTLGHTPRRAPMVDAAIRATIAQGGAVVIVPVHGPNSPRGGVGALLRG